MIEDYCLKIYKIGLKDELYFSAHILALMLTAVSQIGGTVH